MKERTFFFCAPPPFLAIHSLARACDRTIINRTIIHIQKGESSSGQSTQCIRMGANGTGGEAENRLQTSPFNFGSTIF